MLNGEPKHDEINTETGETTHIETENSKAIARDAQTDIETFINFHDEKSPDAEAVGITGIRLDYDIGWHYWKRYVASVFWAQISMPLNLLITLLTALTTAQANAPDLLPAEIYKNVTYISLLLTVMNTFFRPHEKLTTNIKVMKEWMNQGIAFEKVFFSPTALTLRYRGEATLTKVDLKALLDSYNKVRDDINAQRQKEGPEMINFVTDFIHIIAHYTCIRKYQKWSSVVNS